MRHNLSCLAAVPALCLVLAACGDNASTGGEASDAATPVTSEATPDSAQSGGDLMAYVGKYPFDKVDGVSWIENEKVRAGVNSAVPDADLRELILANGNTAGPIELVDGRLAAWACEQHNCGPHQWTVLIDPVSGVADVCYFDEAANPDASRWFLANGTEESRPGNCQLTGG